MSNNDGQGSDLTSSSDLSPEVNGIGMGRRVDQSTSPRRRTLGDFLPNQLRTRSGPMVKGGTPAKVQAIEIFPTGPVWKSAICDPQSTGVILGSLNNSHPYYGRVTRFNSFDDTNDPVWRDLKFSGCNHLVNLNEETFAASFASGCIVLWDYNLTEGDTAIQTFFRHHGNVTDLKSSFDSQYLLSCGDDRKISLIDVKAGVLKDEIREGHSDGVNGVSPSPDGNDCLLTCGINGSISVWDWRVNTGPRSREVASAQSARTPTAVYWSKVDPNLFYVGTSNGSLALFDLRNVTAKKLEYTSGLQLTDCRINRIKPIKDDKFVIVSAKNRFEILQERTMITSFVSKPLDAVIEDIVQVEDSTLYSVGRERKFTKHNFNNQMDHQSSD